MSATCKVSLNCMTLHNTNSVRFRVLSRGSFYSNTSLHQRHFSCKSVVRNASVSQSLCFQRNKTQFLCYHHQQQMKQKQQQQPNSRYKSSCKQPSSPSSIQTPIVIIGGGPTGLLLSSALSYYNVPSTLLECRTPSQVSAHPQAHYLNLRTMEILRHTCSSVLYDNVLDSMPPVEEWEAFTFGHSVLGRRIGKVVHPVRGNLVVGQDGNGLLVEDEDDESFHSDENRNVVNDGKNEEQGCLGVRRISVCNPGHLAQNKFSTLLLEEAERAATSMNNCHDYSDKNETVTNQTNNVTSIRHGVTVTKVVDHAHNNNLHNHGIGKQTNQDHPYPITVHTSTGQIYQTNFVVAADGASSPTRIQHSSSYSSNQSKDDPPLMAGNAAMQHLINVHFTTAPSLSRLLSQQKRNVGMLHFVYNERVVGAYVCHDVTEGEWVLQIPYFPPYQSVERSFDKKKVLDMVLSGLLGPDYHQRTIGNSKIDTLVTINSIKPWTMSSTVARSYLLGPSKRIVLAGDAAHTFPPAGGFGMNTGLQDAHNLAWRLALLWEKQQRQQQQEQRHDRANGLKKSDDDCASHGDFPDYEEAVQTILQQYSNERQRIAAQNAALSVRNYNRTLEIAKACHLNASHPTLLLNVMSSPPLNFMPFSYRREAFESAVTAAMMPLGRLSLSHIGNFYGEGIVRRVRSILRSGGGLPLLFPRFEIGFGYGRAGGGGGGGNFDTLGDQDDTSGYVPAIVVGRRLPHIPLRIILDTSNLSNTHQKDYGCYSLPFKSSSIGTYGHQNDDKLLTGPKTNHAKMEWTELPLVTLTDLESQLRTRWEKPKPPQFTLIVSGSSLIDCNDDNKDGIDNLLGQTIAKHIMKKGGPIVTVMEIFSDYDRAVARSQRLLSSLAEGLDMDQSLEDSSYLCSDHRQSTVVLFDSNATFSSLLSPVRKSNDSNRGNVGIEDLDETNSAIITVRPDGHIADMMTICYESSELQQKKAREIVVQHFTESSILTPFQQHRKV